MTKSTTATIAIKNFADFGAMDGHSQLALAKASLPLFKAYFKATEEEQQRMRHDYRVNFISKHYGLSHDKAQKINEAGKGKDAIDADKVNNAARMFSHWAKKASATLGIEWQGRAGGREAAKVSRELQRQMNALVQAFGKASCSAALKAAKAE